MARNLCEAFARSALRRPGRIAIQWKRDDHWVKISYAELQKDIAVLSSALSRYYGIKPGERAALMVGNRPEWPILFFALLYSGAIPVPANSQGTSEEINNIINNSGCRIAFTESGCPQVNVRSVPVDSDEFKRALYLFPEETPPPKTRRDDIACIMYTSGTTANPKGVMLSHGNLLSNMLSLYKLGFMKEGDGIVSVLPLYHAYAMVVTTVGPLVYGGRVVYPGSIRSKEVMTAIRQSGSALFVGVPIIFEKFHQAIMDSLGRMPGPVRALIRVMTEIMFAIRQKTGVNLARRFFYSIHRTLGHSMRVCMNGGARLNEDIERDLFKFGFTVLNGYGLTETAPVLTVNPARRPKIGSVGLPIANVRIKIDSKDKNGPGEVLASGPNIMKGYYKNEDLTRQVINNGWFKTGDIGYLDGDGYLFLTGRVNDQITLGTGLSILPDEIEAIYSAGAPVSDICVFDIPSENPDHAPVLWAIVVPKADFFDKRGISDPYPHIKKLFEKASKAISIPERLMGFSLTRDVLPRTLLGKIKRREVKRLYLSGMINEIPRPARKSLTDRERKVLDTREAKDVVKLLKERTGMAVISPDDSFELDLGLDIVGRSELAFELEKKLGLKINEDEINRVFTVGELIARMKYRA